MPAQTSKKKPTFSIHLISADINKHRDTVDATAPRVKRLRSNDTLNHLDDSASRIYSQPAPQIRHENDESGADTSNNSHRTDFCYSQPTLMDELILCTQLNPTQGTSQNVFQRLVKRMTRFFVTVKFDETTKRLSAAAEELGYTWKISDGSVVNISISSSFGFRLVLDKS